MTASLLRCQEGRTLSESDHSVRRRPGGWARSRCCSPAVHHQPGVADSRRPFQRPAIHREHDGMVAGQGEVVAEGVQGAG